MRTNNKKWKCFECEGGRVFDGSHAASRECERCKGTGSIDSEQGRISDCAICGCTTARMTDGKKPKPGMGAGFVSHFEKGTMDLQLIFSNERTHAHGYLGMDKTTTLCPRCAPVVQDALLQMGALHPAKAKTLNIKKDT